ncbi:MAG: ICEBs1 excisionase [Clostridium sp.]|nr:ICEBs1 excisionase [Clostridium sp.]
MEKIYYTADDLVEMLGVSKAKAYQIIKLLNEELEKNNYITLQGKVSRAYFNERWYGLKCV